MSDPIVKGIVDNLYGAEESEAPPTQDDDLVMRLTRRCACQRCSECDDERSEAAARIESDAKRIRELEAKNGSLRELMNCYNLGGWTDAERLQSERDEARRELAASRERERALREMFKDGYVLALYDDHGSQVNAWHSPEEFIATIATPDSAASPTGGEG